METAVTWGVGSPSELLPTAPQALTLGVAPYCTCGSNPDMRLALTPPLSTLGSNPDMRLALTPPLSTLGSNPDMRLALTPPAVP